MSSLEHKALAPISVACFVLTVSDTRTAADGRSVGSLPRAARSSSALKRVALARSVGGGVAGVCASAVSAGTIPSSSGNAMVAPSPRNTVRRALTLDPARPDAVDKRHKLGLRTARENIADLCDPGSFHEYGAFVVAAQPTGEGQQCGDAGSDEEVASAQSVVPAVRKRSGQHEGDGSHRDETGRETRLVYAQDEQIHELQTLGERARAPGQEQVLEEAHAMR